MVRGHRGLATTDPFMGMGTTRDPCGLLWPTSINICYAVFYTHLDSLLVALHAVESKLYSTERVKRVLQVC